MYACLDIGGTSIKVGVCDIKGNLFSKDTLYVSHELSEFIDAIVLWIEKVKLEYDINGVAISSPGAVDTKTGTVGGCSAIECIHGPNWKELIKEKTKLPVSIENDANCAALAEVYFGSAKDVNDMIFIVCGTGIGGSIVKDRKIHHGKNLHGGEFGMMIVGQDENGNLFNFSEIASTMSFVRKVRKHYNDETWDGKKVFEAAENGNEFCKNVIEQFYMNLSTGIFNLQHIYDPEKILLGGAISDREGFIEKIDEKIDEIRSKVTINTIKPIIGTCTQKKDANLIGALANFLVEYN